MFIYTYIFIICNSICSYRKQLSFYDSVRFYAQGFLRRLELAQLRPGVKRAVSKTIENVKGGEGKTWTRGYRTFEILRVIPMVKEFEFWVRVVKLKLDRSKKRKMGLKNWLSRLRVFKRGCNESVEAVDGWRWFEKRNGCRKARKFQKVIEADTKMNWMCCRESVWAELELKVNLFKILYVRCRWKHW